MLIAIFIFLILLTIQFIIALYALLVKHDIHKRYAHPLGEQIEAAKALENYVKIYRKVNLRVNAVIDTPAWAMEEFILINKSRIYSTDLFTNFFTLFQLELSRKQNNFARKVKFFQALFFAIQTILFVAGLFFVNKNNETAEILIYLSLGTLMFNILLSFIAFASRTFILQDSMAIATDLLNLDEVENARAESLKNDLKFEVFEYPISLLKNIVLFFIPGS